MTDSSFSIIDQPLTTCLLKQQDQEITESDIEEIPKDDDGDGEGSIICRNCYNILTKSINRAFINGSHKHVFANPHGHVFEIVCFRQVTGCGHTGIATDEFSWFSGYSWKIAVCSNCLVHLGWMFTAPDKERFHGLILNQIVESRSSSSSFK